MATKTPKIAKNRENAPLNEVLYFCGPRPHIAMWLQSAISCGFERFLAILGAPDAHPARLIPKGAQISSKPQTTTGQNFWYSEDTKSKLTPLESL